MNDPFLPPEALPSEKEVSKAVTLLQPAHGGHVGFHGDGDPQPFSDRVIADFFDRGETAWP